MLKLLDGQVALITGAARGIGAATARRFAEHGARLMLTDIDQEPLEEIVKELQETGAEVRGVPGNITVKSFPDTLMVATENAYGKLNILVNNAGYTWDSVLHKMTDEQWGAMLDIHVTAPFRMVRAAAPLMLQAAKNELAESRRAEPRCIVNVSSTSGLHGNAGQANYATGKMGIVGFSKTVAKEWGSFGIRCNTVAFGFIETRLTEAKERGAIVERDGQEIRLGIPEQIRQMSAMMIPLGRPGRAEEAANGILMLASPLASYITGHTLEVTGGMGI